MNVKKKKIPQKAYLISVVVLVVVTLLVVFATSYFGTDKNTVPEDEPSIPVPPPVTAQPTPDVINNNDDDIDDDPEPQIEETIISINEINPGLTYSLDYFAAKANAVAASIAVFDGNAQDFYVYQYGYKDISAQTSVGTDTVFIVASLSKLVAVICAMTLVDVGLLDLDKDISEYLGYEIRNPRFRDIPITTRMLMQHTASLAYIDAAVYFNLENLDQPETIQKLLESRTTWENWEPGIQYSYSAWLAHSLVAIICEKLSGQRFDAFAHNVLFDPIGINAAFLANNLKNKENIAVQYNFYSHEIVYSVQDLFLADYNTRVSDHDRVGAHLLINAVDYAKILIMLGNGGVFNETRILSEKSIHEITNTNHDGDYYLQGLSTRYESDTSKPFAGYYWHAGGAWGTSAHYIHRFDEGTNHGVVVITTGVYDYYPRETVVDMTALAMQVLKNK